LLNVGNRDISVTFPKADAQSLVVSPKTKH